MEGNLKTEGLGNSPHSIAIWMCVEIHKRRPDGNLSGMPVGHKKFNGVINCRDEVEANLILQTIVDAVHKDIENVKTSLI